MDQQLLSPKSLLTHKMEKTSEWMVCRRQNEGEIAGLVQPLRYVNEEIPLGPITAVVVCSTATCS